MARQVQALKVAARRIATALWRVLADEQTGRLDVAQLLHFAGVALVSYGAHLIYAPAGFLVSGSLLIWWTLPTRPPFVMRSHSEVDR